MRTESKYFLSSDKIRLLGNFYFPEINPGAVIALVHGTGEHSLRYGHVAEFFTEKGFGFASFDLRGHGVSEGKKAHSPSLDLLMDDIELFLKEVKTRFPGIPLFLLGHSMGGNLVLNYALRRKPELTGVIALSPGLKTTRPTSPLKLALARQIARFRPSMLFHNGVRAKDLSRDPVVIENVLNDPMYFFQISARLGVDILDAGKWALENAEDFSLPLLLMHGTADNITSKDATVEFARKVKSPCVLKLWDGFYHELHNEPEKEAPLDYAARWIKLFAEDSLRSQI